MVPLCKRISTSAFSANVMVPILASLCILMKQTILRPMDIILVINSAITFKVVRIIVDKFVVTLIHHILLNLVFYIESRSFGQLTLEVV